MFQKFTFVIYSILHTPFTYLRFSIKSIYFQKDHIIQFIDYGVLKILSASLKRDQDWEHYLLQMKNIL